ncbi:Mrx7p KNAG_0F01000 [Huiozyma naganishii CBS 8797]|uniref:Uncharacterized protein n=1 Tax=Huiozyma naganishii (strain ATCC MYA-139 / BCRC 22969 / CBS 8797 / KCTC 17520 / NBRC 10181 / NCYC 3082 / Yp74L-3) TaxID=1071383 RepID=J7S747_HUIN7|nr:hypothetical protein KNAG_0F01000 [Kazachstania naganishii CBS 8797]CCK70769.1 hypothetical protein KNAG_0F01000 [Kazachstania naganishii CBS 8797]
MRRAPRTLQEWLYFKLLDSPAFHRFVRRIYRRVNGIRDNATMEFEKQESDLLYRPTSWHKFKAFRYLYWDEIRATFGFPRRFNANRFKGK